MPRHRAKDSRQGAAGSSRFDRNGEAEVDENSKLQITNNKQITMTKIVRASLGLPTLRAGPQFQNFKSVLVIEY
jgi:hypothetical protein